MSSIVVNVPNNDSTWEAIDIYLFSNGQEYSPPRKYHLQAEDLNWWDATLNDLARSQYGALHSRIELYTLTGQKVTGPLELKGGLPYVAVVPPDAFIDTGYEKYLIKASKSWEKRQTKRRMSIADESEEKCAGCGQSHPCCPCPTKDNSPSQIYSENPVMANIPMEVTTLKTPDDNFAVESVLVKPRRSSTSKIDKPESLQPRSIIAAPRMSNARYERRRSSGQRTSFLKPPNTPDSLLKANSKSKEAFHRKTFTKIPVSIKDPKKATAAGSITKASSQNRSEPPPQLLLQKAITSNNKELATDQQKLYSDKEIIVISTDTNLYKNTESEIRSVKLDANRVPVVNEMISCYMPQPAVNEEVQTQIENSIAEVNTSRRDLSTTNSNVKLVPVANGKRTNFISCDIPIADNYIAVINKGDAVKLNLNIELQDYPGRCANGISGSSYREVQNTSSLMNVFERKTFSRNDVETAVHSKSLQSLISGINEPFAKVVVVQCGCCGNNTAVPRMDTMPVYKDNNGFFILMPNPTPGNDQSCVCGHENVHERKKTITEICLGDLTRPTADTVFPCMTHPTGIIMKVAESRLRADKIQKKEGAVLEQRVNAIDKELNTENSFRTSSMIVEKTEYLVSSSVPKEPSSVDTYTQTSWCGVLLQAKAHDDGRFSFHLPSLEILKLKYYKRAQ